MNKPTKRTYWLAEFISGSPCHEWTATRKITCEVTGQMSDGTLVWTEVETGEQYFCFRMLGTYYFYQV